MREGIWRRVIAGLALVIGVGLFAPAAGAEAAPVAGTSAIGHPTPTAQLDGDWWW